MLWDPSVLDSEEGIRFWGRSIPECQEVLPTAPGGTEMLPEAMFWYLLTGRVPSEAESKQFQEELVERSELPTYVEKVLDSLRASLSLSLSTLFPDRVAPADPCPPPPPPRAQPRRSTR